MFIAMSGSEIMTLLFKVYKRHIRDQTDVCSIRYVAN